MGLFSRNFPGPFTFATPPLVRLRPYVQGVHTGTLPEEPPETRYSSFSIALLITGQVFPTGIAQLIIRPIEAL